jgi:hypothetical protein
LPQSEGEGGSIATKASVLRPYKPTEEEGFRAMLEMKCNSEEVLNTNLTKEAEACTLTRGVRGMENERDEWKTLEAQQTIERDAIRTASAQVYKQPPRPQSLQLREALNCKEANGPTGRREGPQVCQRRGGKVGGLLNCLVL